MSSLRPTSRMLLRTRTTALRPAFTTTPPRAVRTYATQDYGSGDGNPAAENPQQQGKRGREDLEHPGPEPPKVAKKDGKTNQSSGGGEGKTASGSAKDKKNVGGGNSKPQPKLNVSEPPEPQNESAEVKKHNEEMSNRAEKAKVSAP